MFGPFRRRGGGAASWLAVGALAACADTAPTAAPPAATAAAEPGVVRINAVQRNGQWHVAGRVVVRFRDGADVRAVASRHGADVVGKLRLARTEVLAVEPGTELEVARSLAEDPAVEIAEVDDLTIIVPCEASTACDATNEGFITRRWDLHNDGTIEDRVSNPAFLASTGKVDADIDWVEMYDRLGASFAGRATIGIVDTGIKDDHIDLAGRVIAAKNFAGGYPETLTTDRDSHGTHVAGIAAANGLNALGTPGVAYGANIKLINAKACERYIFPDGVTRTSCPNTSVANAIVYAVDQGANVINLSLGGSPTAAMRAALAYALSKHVAPFCATGNGNGTVSYPAAFPECYGVGATDWLDTRASYSNFGPETDIVAPGGDGELVPHSLILAPQGNRAETTFYTYKAGTSMATPQVAGLAAMLYAAGVATTPTDILARLQSTADDLGPAGRDDEFGAGRINAYRAIFGVSPDAPPVAVLSASTTSITEGGSVAFSSAGSNDPNAKPISFFWEFGDGSTSTAANPSKRYADDCDCAVRLTVTDASGRKGTTTLGVTVSNVAPAVSAALDAPTITSGGTARLVGGFSDPGANDAPWAWAIDWGVGATTTGATGDRLASIVGTRRYCAAGAYDVRFGVTDKDGGVGSTARSLQVVRGAVALQVAGSVNAGANGVLPIALLGSAAYGAALVDPASVTLGKGTPVARRDDGSLHAELADVNGDGRLDWALKFDRTAMRDAGELLPEAGAATLALYGTLTDGCTQVGGSAVVRVVPVK